MGGHRLSITVPFGVNHRRPPPSIVGCLRPSTHDFSIRCSTLSVSSYSKLAGHTGPNRYWLCAATEQSIKIWDLESKSVVEDLKVDLKAEVERAEDTTGTVILTVVEDSIQSLHAKFCLVSNMDLLKYATRFDLGVVLNNDLKIIHHFQVADEKGYILTRETLWPDYRL
ncbi:hypothetical protein QQ045_016873 [Rhodiola kirilowii]